MKKYFTLIDRAAQEHKLEIPEGISLNLMEYLRSAGFDIEGICGGICLCATCHVYTLPDYCKTEVTEDELDMLDQSLLNKPSSRLACQIPVDEDLDGYRIELAPVPL